MELIEQAARTCYLSFERTGEGSAERLVRSIIRRGHHSVLEHASATFRIRGGSRSFTHQLIRHRLASFSQQSQRYVDETGFNWVEPESIKNDGKAHKLFTDLMANIRDTYIELKKMGVHKQDARFVLPNAAESEIVFSANFREFRHIFKLRCHPAAQWEIRRICLQMLRVLKEKAPVVFEDFKIDEESESAVTEIDA